MIFPSSAFFHFRGNSPGHVDDVTKNQETRKAQRSNDANQFSKLKMNYTKMLASLAPSLEIESKTAASNSLRWPKGVANMWKIVLFIHLSFSHSYIFKLFNFHWKIEKLHSVAQVITAQAQITLSATAKLCYFSASSNLWHRLVTTIL